MLRVGCGFCRGAVCDLLGGAVNVRGKHFFPATNTTVPPTMRRFILSIKVGVMTNCKLARSATAITYRGSGSRIINSIKHVVPRIRIEVKRGGRVVLHNRKVARNCCGGRTTAGTTFARSK